MADLCELVEKRVVRGDCLSPHFMRSVAAYK
jgi:hypothetical protein